MSGELLSRPVRTIRAPQRYGMKPLTYGIRAWIAEQRQHLRDAQQLEMMTLLAQGIAKALAPRADVEPEVHVGDPDGIETREVLSGVYI